MDDTDEKNYCILKWKGLDGKTFQVCDGADVLLAFEQQRQI